ncbi:MAG: peroxiredoxin family protein [Myxococcota bacterium]
MDTGLLLAAAGLAALTGGAGIWLWRVSRGDLRPPVPAYVGVLVGSGLAGAGLLVAVAAGEALVPVGAVAAAVFALAAVALTLHRLRRVPQDRLAVRLGEPLLPFSALTPEGERFDSASLAGQRVLLKFFRGEWCPFCQAELRAFDAMRDALGAHGVRVVALSKDPPEAARRHRERDGLVGVALLCDPELDVIRQYGVEHHKALQIAGPTRLTILGLAMGLRPSVRTMAAPTTLLVDERGIVRWIDQTDDYKVRSSAERVLGAVAAAFGAATAPVAVPAAIVDDPACVAC